MLCRLRILSYGRHNNLHISMRIGRTNRNPIMILKLVVLFDQECALISHSNLHEDYRLLLNYENVINVIQQRLDKMDLNLKVFSNDDFFNKNVSTEELLIRLKNEDKCIVSARRSEECYV